MNLFWKNLFGALTPTAKLEKKEIELINDMHRYLKVKKSAELSEYKELYHIVKSAKFQENKKTLQNRKYKDTEEYHTYRKYNKLHKSNSIRIYYTVLRSVALKLYLAFKASAEYESLGNKKLVESSERLQNFKKFEHSKEYKIFTRFHDSYIIKEYEELKIKMASPDFKAANEFWANEKRWHGTPEFIQQERFYELAKNPDIIFYENEEPKRFEKHQSLSMSYRDEFSGNTLDKTRWSSSFHYKAAGLIDAHSFSNEKQANNSGKNVAVEDGILKIKTKNEKVSAPAWDTKKGFIKKEFQYTSDILQSANSFRQKYGVFRAKVRCTGKLHHAFWLGSDEKLPLINIFHYNGKCITVGNVNENTVDGVEIKGLNPSTFYIYTLIWTEKELVWMINNLEVYRTTSHIPNQRMYLGFNSFISEKQKGNTGSLEVDWIKVYRFMGDAKKELADEEIKELV